MTLNLLLQTVPDDRAIRNNSKNREYQPEAFNEKNEARHVSYYSYTHYTGATAAAGPVPIFPP